MLGEEYAPPPDSNPDDGTDPDDTDDTYIPPDDTNNGGAGDISKPESLTDKIKVALGPAGEHSELVIGGFIALCVFCGFCTMKNGCKCCSSSVEYDSDDEEDEYGFDDDDDSSEYTSGTYTSRSSRGSSTSSGGSAFEEYDNPMNKGRPPKGMRVDSKGLLAVEKKR